MIGTPLPEPHIAVFNDERVQVVAGGPDIDLGGFGALLYSDLHPKGRATSVGLELLLRLRRTHHAMPMAFLTDAPSEDQRALALRTRVSYVDATRSHNETTHALCELARQAQIVPALRRRFVEQVAADFGLTDTHHRVLELILLSMRREDLSLALNVKPRTIDFHLAEIRERVSVERYEDILRALLQHALMLLSDGQELPELTLRRRR